MIRQVSSSVIRSLSAHGGKSQVPKKFVGTARCLSTSPWANYEMAPLDPIIGLTEQYNQDSFPQKVIVGVGAYRDDGGKPYILPCVREAEDRLFKKHLDMEYSGIAGDANFVEESLKFGYGEDCVALQENRVQGVQALSGTGGLRVMGELLRKNGHRHIYVPNPTWGNHKAIFTNAGLEVKTYAYYDAESSSLDFDSLVKDLKDIPSGSAVLLHACAHNPTGMDPTMDQWKEISSICKERGLLPFFDMAYQGFASGCAATDAAALRMFVDEGHLVCTIQSFSKNFGLYGHRVGTLSVVGATEEEAQKVVSQLKLVIRPMYSNPPRHGARIVQTILSDPMLREDWEVQCAGMAARINTMRTVLRERLSAVGSSRNWNHITKQIGMFAFSGLSKEQVMKMREKHHVYCTLDGRISMAGVTSGNADYIAEAIHDVSK
ncbi:Aspartate aminotransferase, mitochondrial [Seminavis robusta]|uniref:Aspartate aminotransferase n=1 Tax=Seminavis robusta TaxID=568900 RepID=A0A9N8E9S7_9STRA|nr:Aspartate aminotransferase, mitochondrial [Seminavis robusta]|eukprot:Sro834_g208710.1 Aspartate aminotransferase, mitochondrial (434) ;mRNA; r:25064-26636